MKKLAIAMAFSMAALSVVPAHADGWRRDRGNYRGGYNGGYHHNHSGGAKWVAPLIGGAIIGGLLANQYRSAPRYYDPGYYEPRYYQPDIVCHDVQMTDWDGPYYERRCWQR